DSLPPSTPASSQISARRKLPPPPPHEDRPEHYKKRLKLPVEDAKGTGRQEPAKPGSAKSGSVCLIEPPASTAGAKATVRPFAISPVAIVYLFPDQFLPPKKLRQHKREMHNFFVVEREALAALLLVQAIFSLRRRSALKISQVSAIVPLLRRKLELGENEK